MIVAIVRSTHIKETTTTANGLTYLASRDFKVSIYCLPLFLQVHSPVSKEHVYMRLHLLVLDPGLWSYKLGLLERVLVSIKDQTC